MNITKEQFEGYEGIRQSGITNMWAVQTVIDSAKKYYDCDLTTEECLYIMKHYVELREKYMPVKA